MRQSLYQFISKIRTLLSDKFQQYDAKLPYLLTVLIALIVVIVGVNAFIELTDTLESEMLNKWDTKVTDYVISFRTPALTKYFMFVTDIGDLYGYLVVMGLFICKYFLFYFQALEIRCANSTGTLTGSDI